jgi:hypothetical protein
MEEIAAQNAVNIMDSVKGDTPSSKTLRVSYLKTFGHWICHQDEVSIAKLTPLLLSHTCGTRLSTLFLSVFLIMFACAWHLYAYDVCVTTCS